MAIKLGIRIGLAFGARSAARSTARASTSASGTTSSTIPAVRASSAEYRRPVTIASWAVRGGTMAGIRAFCGVSNPKAGLGAARSMDFSSIRTMRSFCIAGLMTVRTMMPLKVWVARPTMPVSEFTTMSPPGRLSVLWMTLSLPWLNDQSAPMSLATPRMISRASPNNTTGCGYWKPPSLGDMNPLAMP